MSLPQRVATAVVLSLLTINSTPATDNAVENAVTPYTDNSRYLAMDGVPIFGLGATHPHSWTPISRPEEFDLLADLDRLAGIVERVGSEHVRGFVRVLPYDPMGIHDGKVERVLQPWHRRGDGRYDLEQFNPEWEHRLRAFLDAAHERQIVVSLEVWDDWSLTRGPGGAYDPGENAAWNGHPFNPNNNINYDADALPTSTSACQAPFYQTLPSDGGGEAVLRLQQRYVDRLVEIAGTYPNAIWNISNESRAHVEWSRYWAKYLRQRLPEERMIGEMPSTNREDGGGQCDYDLNPLTLSTDNRYDYVDVAQGISRHEFGGNPVNQAVGGAERIRQYQRAMEAHGQIKPLVVSKEYARNGPGGTVVFWSRFTGGAATVRFHRPSGDRAAQVSDFQYKIAERLAGFVARTRFWRMKPITNLVSSDLENAIVLGEHRHEYVVHLMGERQPLKLELALSSGKWRTWLYDPHQGTYVGKGGDEGWTVEAWEGSPAQLVVPAHEHSLIVHLKPEADG